MATGRASGHKNFASFPLFFNMDDNKHGRGTAHSTSWATPSAYEKQSDGDPAKLQDGVPVIMKVTDLMPCREAGGGDGRILLMFQAA